MWNLHRQWWQCISVLPKICAVFPAAPETKQHGSPQGKPRPLLLPATSNMTYTPITTVATDDQPQTGPNEPPPPSYSSRPQSSSTPTPFKTKPTNFLTLSIGDTPGTRSEFVIDPSIRLPASLLPPLGEGETEENRKNLSLTSKSSLNTDIWLLPPSGMHKHQHISIALTSEYGAVHAQLHTLEGAPPFLLTARGFQWMTRIALPRSFQGLLLLSTRYNSITLSNALLQDVTQLSQLGTTQRYFVGDLRELREEEWKGSRVEIAAPYGWIWVKYDDEVVETQGVTGLLNWLFGK